MVVVQARVQHILCEIIGRFFFMLKPNQRPRFGAFEVLGVEARAGDRVDEEA